MLNPDVLSFETLASTRCLVLLGEPGIGKSIESEKQYEITQGRVKMDGNEALFFNLRDFDSGIFVHNAIFNNQQFLSWLSQSNQLYLYLDSLDEGLLSVKTLAALVASELKKCPVDRLFLRITRRTAEWPEVLTTELKKLWGNEQVKFVELAPLRRKDVYQAAETFGIVPNAFLEAVSQREAVPLATRPLTLDFLLKTFRKDQQLPATKAALYAAGCSLLCEEQNENRLASGCRPFLDFIEQTLKQHPRLRATRLFEMLRDRGYQGDIFQLRRAVRKLRPISREAFLRLSVLPGEHYGKCRVMLRDGGDPTFEGIFSAVVGFLCYITGFKDAMGANIVGIYDGSTLEPISDT